MAASGHPASVHICHTQPEAQFSVTSAALPVLKRTRWVGGFVNSAAIPVAANGETCQVTFHPGFAIHPSLLSAALITIALAGAASAESTQGTPTASACQVRLSSDRAVFKPLGELAGEPSGPARCGAPDAVLLQRIILEDHTQVAVEPPATMRCEMAEAVTDFVREELAPAAAAMGSPLSAIENYDSYSCRGRNRVAGAKLSEHGLANALDIRSLRLKDGRVVRPADAGAQMEFRSAMKTAACSRFSFHPVTAATLPKTLMIAVLCTGWKVPPPPTMSSATARP